MDNAPVTDDEMQAAWNRMHRPGWPPLEEITRMARMYQQLRAAALSRGRGHPAPVQASAPAPAAAPAPPARAAIPIPHHPPVFDAKRAASGERPDADE